MAGAGYKSFSAGSVLTANEVNTYLMEQSVMYFAGTATRSSAIPTPSAGMVTYVNDLAQVQYYNGSAWVAVGAGGGAGLQDIFLLMGA